jgi:hypothetical protein
VTTRYRSIVVHDLEALARIAGIQVTHRAWNRPVGEGRTFAASGTDPFDDEQRAASRHLDRALPLPLLPLRLAGSSPGDRPGRE